MEAVLAEWQSVFREWQEGPPEWKRKAICSGLDPEMFHPLRGESEETAKIICAQCPVQTECLEYALVNVERNGVWGGASERERRMIRRERHTARTLGVTIDEAREVVRTQISEQLPVRRLAQRYGYTQAQAAFVFSMSGALGSHASEAVLERLSRRQEVNAAPLHLRRLMRKFDYSAAQAATVWARGGRSAVA